MIFVDGITITTLVENYVDMLIPNTERIKRPGLAFHFDPRNKPIQAENGISMLVDISFAGQNYRILFDAGLSDSVILHNMSALKISPDIIDHAVISHGHPDHYGGLLAVLKARSVPLPVIIHPNAFLTWYVVAGNGWVIPYYNQSLRKEELEAAGGRLVLAANPVQSDKTIEELKRLNPAIVSPMHCSGFKTLAAVAREMPEAFLLNTAGAQITL